MAVELVRQTWCDVCMADGARNAAEWSNTVAVGGDEREIDLCTGHADDLMRAIGVVFTRGRTPENGPAIVRDRIECPICGLTYSKRSGLRAHYVKEHPTYRMPPPDAGERRIGPAMRCTVCGNSFRGGTGLAAHVRTQHPDVWSARNAPTPAPEPGPRFACTECDARFSTERSLGAHVRQKHAKQNAGGRRRLDIDGA